MDHTVVNALFHRLFFLSSFVGQRGVEAPRDSSRARKLDRSHHISAGLVRDLRPFATQERRSLTSPALRAVALRAVALRAVALRAVALRAVALRAVALRAVALRVFDYSSRERCGEKFTLWNDWGQERDLFKVSPNVGLESPTRHLEACATSPACSSC